MSHFTPGWVHLIYTWVKLYTGVVLNLSNLSDNFTQDIVFT